VDKIKFFNMDSAIKIRQVSSDSNLTFDDILKSVSTLETNEIMQFMHEISKIVARRKVKALSLKESELLKNINESVSTKLQNQYETLAVKLNDETITEKEHQQLLKVIAKLEESKATKLEYMIELARLRNTTLKDVAHQLQAQTIFYA
jgi:hypothetical protein